MKLDAAARLTQLYPDRHLNIFVPYGTHDLDYNLTRALICTLRWSEPGLARRFLSEVCGVTIAEDTSVLYDLQACDYDDYDPEACETRKLLGISRGGAVATRLPAVDNIYQPHVLAVLRGAGHPAARLAGLRNMVGNPDLTIDDLEVLEHTLEEYESGSLPDGWIFTADGKACVLIEAKLTRFLDQHQLDRHAETWFGEVRRGDDQVLTTWEAIAGFAAANADNADPRTAFLCRQLFEYLECLGQAPFESFKPFDLDGDSLHGSIPKARRFVEEAAKQAFDAGLPVGSDAIAIGTGVRVGFSDASLVGTVGVELSDDRVSFVWVVGEPLGTSRLSGPEGADELLARCDGGMINPLEGLELKGEGYQIRVERLVRNERGYGIDRTVYEDEFKAANFSEGLDELLTQHPNPEQREAQGRSGVLALRRTLVGEEALASREALLAAAVESFTDFVAIARSIKATGEPVEAGAAEVEDAEE